MLLIVYSLHLLLYRMIHMELHGSYQMPRENCMPIRLFQHLKRCYCLQWHEMLVSCLISKQWMTACAKAIHISFSMDRLLWMLYVNSSFPITRFIADFLMYSHVNLCVRQLLIIRRQPSVFTTNNSTRLTALCPGLPRWASARKVKPIWIYWSKTVSHSGMSWTICKPPPCPRQMTTPAPHHSAFFGPDALPATQPTVSKHWRQSSLTKPSVLFLHELNFIFWADVYANLELVDKFLADRTIGRDFGTLCRLSAVCLSVTFCIVAKWYVLAKNCLKEWIG